MIQRELFHPDLRERDSTYLALRSGWFSFFFPPHERIYWFGNLIRPDGDKGAGMYATDAQAATWPNKVANGSVIGPG